MKRKLLLATCAVMVCASLVGCGAKSGSKSISVNAMKSEMTLKNVNYYDFVWYEKISDYNGTCYSLSVDSTNVQFLDAEGEYRCLCTDKKLMEKPSSVKVYTNINKTSYDTYSCSY